MRALRLFFVASVSLAAFTVADDAFAIQTTADCSKFVTVGQWSDAMYFTVSATLEAQDGSTYVPIDTVTSDYLLPASGHFLTGAPWTVAPSPGTHRVASTTVIYMTATHALSETERASWPANLRQESTTTGSPFQCGASPPVITSTPGTSARVSEQYSYQMQVSYSGNTSALRYVFVGGPQDAVLGWTTGLLTFTPDSEDVGLRPVILRVNGENNLFAIQAYVLDVHVNTAPTANNDSFSTNENTPLTANVLTNDTDPHGDALSATMVDDPIHGVASISSSGVLSYTPDAEFFGTDTLTYRASDNPLTSGLATVTITVVRDNEAPVAQEDDYEVVENSVLAIELPESILSNDSDADDDPISAQVVDYVSHGTLVLQGSGDFSYTPDEDYVGSDSFTYVAFDGTDLSNVATVSIVVLSSNEPPAITVSAPPTAIENAPYSASASASDPESGIILYSISRGPLGMAVNSTGEISWTPRSSQVGEHEVVVRATDPLALYAETSFTVDVSNVNDAPMILSSPLNRVDAGQVYEYQVFATDLENDALTYTLLEGPANLSLTASGLMSWSPTNADVGLHEVRVRVSDPHGGADEQEFGITVRLNSAPVASFTTRNKVDLALPFHGASVTFSHSACAAYPNVSGCNPLATGRFEAVIDLAGDL